MIQILLATYNGANFLDAQLNSLLNQTYKKWVLLIHDDGSTDNTLEILKRYQSLYPDKISLLEDGITFGNARDNFTHLLEASSGKYVMFCDQDDVWLPKKIEKTLNKMQTLERLHKSTAIVVHSDLEVVDTDLNTIALSMFDYQGLNKSINGLLQILVKNSVTGCTMMMNRQAIMVSLPIKSCAIMHDWWIAASVIKHGGLVEIIDEPLIQYRQHSSNSVGAKKNSIINIVKRVYDRFIQPKLIVNVWLQAKAIDSRVTIHHFVSRKVKLVIKSIFKNIFR